MERVPFLDQLCDARLKLFILFLDLGEIDQGDFQRGLVVLIQCYQLLLQLSNLRLKLATFLPNQIHRLKAKLTFGFK